MLKKSITYTDFNGDEVTEDFYFHLSKADLVEMEVSHKGGLGAYLREIAESEDGAKVIAEFRKLILASYGVRSDDGKRFVKSQELRDEFLATEAYSSLFMDLCTDAQVAAEFVNGIVPKGLDKDVAKLQARGGDPQVHPSDKAAQPQAPNLASESEADPTALEPGRNVFEQGGQGKQEAKLLTLAEMIEMDSEDLKSGLATGRYKLQ